MIADLLSQQFDQVFDFVYLLAKIVLVTADVGVLRGKVLQAFVIILELLALLNDILRKSPLNLGGIGLSTCECLNL